MDEQEAMNRTAKTWLMARGIIALAVAEREGRTLRNEGDLNFAAAVIARLAHNDPPLLICTADEIKD